jgi:iodotyrosine deiodinase
MASFENSHEESFIEFHSLPPDRFGSVQSIRFLADMKQRRSVRHFSRQPVAIDLLLNAIAVAGTAPSGANSQPWHFAIIQSQEMKDLIRAEAEKVERHFYDDRASPQWRRDLKPLGTTAKKDYLSEAPYLIAVFSRQRQSHEREGGELLPLDRARRLRGHVVDNSVHTFDFIRDAV